MSTFELYLRLGFQHIADIRGYDHILFLVALCALYLVKDWRKVLVLVTAFTLGHSLTLALSTLNIVVIPSAIIEFLIPVTIFITALLNFLQNPERREHTLGTKQSRNYALALFFGLIHGLGFSNYLKSLLGQEESILTPLFAFNVGLEIGQLMIVAIILGISYLIVNILQAPRKAWIFVVSGLAALVSLKLMYETGGELVGG
jgi:hypothetical protein